MTITFPRTLALGIAAAMILIAAFTIATPSASAVDSRPAAAAAVHQVLTTRDTARIHTALGTAHRAAEHQHRLTRAAVMVESHARVQTAIADSLALDTLRLPEAYLARTDEAVQWMTVAALRDTALQWSDVRADSLQQALVVSEERAVRADSVIARFRPAQAPNRCSATCVIARSGIIAGVALTGVIVVHRR